MGSTRTFESAVEILLKGGPAAIALLALLLALLIRYRTKSAHAVLRWLWRLTSGATNSSNVAFNDYMDKQDCLMQFRFISGKARTVAQMHALINWCDTHNEDMIDVNACGSHFDREMPGLKAADKRPARSALNWMTAGLVPFGLLVLTCALLAAVPSAVVTVKETDKLLLVNMTSARSAWAPGTERITPDQCRLPIAQQVAGSGFSATDATVICGIYADPKAPAYLDRTIDQQRFLFGALAVYILFVFIVLYRQLLNGRAALAMAKRLDRPRP